MRASAAAGAPSTHLDFRMLANGVPHIMWIAGTDGISEFLNEQGTTFFGRSVDLATAEDWASMFHPDDVERAVREWKRVLKTRALFRMDCRLRRYDGEYCWHTMRARPIYDDLGQLLKWVGTATDIDDSKMLEADLRFAKRDAAETLALLETLQSKAPVGFGFVDRDYRQIRVNDTLAAFNGSTVEAEIGQLVPDVVPAVWPQLEPLYRRVLDTGESILGIEITDPSGDDPHHSRHWLNSYYPVSLGDEIIGVGVVVVEVSERRKAEQEYRQLADIVKDFGDAIFASTTGGIVTSWNLAAERLFGFSATEMIGQSVKVLAPGSLADEQLHMRKRIVAGGGAERSDTVRRCKDGSLVDVHVTASPLIDDDGTVVGLSVIVEDITERVAAERAVEASSRRFAEAQRIAEVGSFELDLLTGEFVWSDEFYRILGIDAGLTPHVDLINAVIHPDDWAFLNQGWRDVVERGIPFDLSYRIIRPSGEQRWVQGRAIPEIAVDGHVTKLSGTLRDNTERVHTEQAHQLAENRFEAGFQQGGIGVGILDLQGVPMRVNAAACEILGRSEESLIGRSWVEFGHPDDVPLATAVATRIAAGHDTYADERRYLRPDGSLVWTALHITLVRDEAGEPEYYLAQMQAICERKQMEEDLVHQALHDSLTGLANRALLTDRLLHGLALARQRHSDLAVIFLDLDQFKVINDSLGHTAGDDLLKQTATRIAAAIRPGDTLARFGGDEFVVVCDDTSTGEAGQIADRIRKAVGQPYLIGTKEVNVTASLGIVIADREATPESVLGDSDAAMYAAKGLGRDRIELFDNALRFKAERRLSNASDLRHALDREEFVVHYQPVVDLITGTMVSAEALLRWMHPERGLVAPADFIPLAEETGIIVPIGAWVLEQACLQLVEWQRTAPSMSIAVNLSVRQMLAPDITAVIDDILKRTGVSPASVCLELTESVFMEDADYFARTLAGIKALGVNLSIDDFGTGYSSLSYLKQFPVDEVKIDRAFVDGLGTDAHDSALVAAILAMADALDLGVIAEGVENRAQLAILKKLRCQRAQGFYLARPMSGADMHALVAEGRHWDVD